MYCFKGIYDECLDCFLKSLRHTEQIGNEMYVGVTLNNIGSVYYLLEDYEKALDFYEQSYKVYRRINSDYGIALSSNNIGSVFLDYQQNLDSAYFYLKIAEEYSKKINYTEQLAETTVNLARLFGLKDDFDLAKDYYNKSIQLNKSIENQRGLAQSYLSFASLFFDKNLYYRSNIYLDSCISISKKIQTLEFETQAYQWKYRCDTALGDYQNAFVNLLIFKELNDSIAKIQVQENITALQSEFDIERKEKENQILLEKQAKQELIIQRQRLYNIFISVALVLFVVLIVMLYSILKQRKRHFEMLYSKNQEILQQKEEILAQNEVLNEQNEKIKQRNSEIESQKNILQKYQNDIQSSINYAKRIQSAILPEEKELISVYSGAMLLNLPKNIISGDFYFFKKIENKSFVAVADCTGHGVPVALMSILNMTLLKEVMRENSQWTAAQILDKIRELVKNLLKQTADQKTVHDGMDIAMILYDKDKLKINYAGAYRPLYIVRNSELIEIAADKQAIAAYVKEKPFTDNFLEVKKDDIFISSVMVFTTRFQLLFPKNLVFLILMN